MSTPSRPTGITFPRGRRAAAALTALGLVGAIASLVVALPRPASRARGAAHAPVPTRLGWARGRAYRYALSARSEQQTRQAAGAAPIEGVMDLAGDVVVRCYEASAGSFRLGIALDRMTTARVRVGAANVVSGPEALAGEAFLVTDERGRVTGSQYRTDAPEALKAVLPNVLALLQVTLPEPGPAGAPPLASWDLREPTMLGTAHTRYAPAEDAPLTFDRTRLAYDDLLALPHRPEPDLPLSSHDAITLTADAVPDHIVIDESVGVQPGFTARITADLALSGVTDFDPAVSGPGQLSALTPGVRPQAPALPVGDQMLRQLAGDMTLARIEALAGGAAPGVRMPPGYITAAVALLKLDPALCDGLVEMFERPHASLATRVLLLDLLASAGHGRAQAAMRDALSSDAARADATSYGTLLQHLGMVLVPEPKILEFASVAYASGKGVTRDAAAFALGAVLGSRGAANVDPAFDRYLRPLRADLEAAKTRDARVTLLAALGNAGSPRDGARIAAYAHDADARVRRQVALSLRKERSDGARGTLFSMLGDKDASVGGAALTSLADNGIKPDDLSKLAGLVGTPGLSGELHEPLLSVVGEATRAHPQEAAAVLRAVVATARDPHTRARARMLLDQCGV